METTRFDTLTRTLARLQTRRTAATLLGWGALSLLPLLGEAKKKRKKRRRKPKQSPPNTFGCIDAGKFCANAGQCCSGICQGKKGKKTCRAHDQGACLAGQGCISGGASQPCLTDAGEVGACQTTTGNAGYCAGSGDCVACVRDTDCIQFCGPQAACINCPGCITSDGVETSCVGPRPDSCQFPV